MIYFPRSDGFINYLSQAKPAWENTSLGFIEAVHQWK